MNSLNLNTTKTLILLLCGAVLVFTSANCKSKCELKPKAGFTIVGDDADCYYKPDGGGGNPETTYNVCDLYNAGGVKGIVFAVSADKKHGSILAIENITLAQYRWATLKEVTGATDTLDGANNMAKIKTMANWQTNYPAFKYWDDKGFYIPAQNEARTIFKNYTTIKAAVENAGGTFDFLNTNTVYLSTEASMNECLALVNFSNGFVFNQFNKVTQSPQDFTLGIRKF